MHTRLNNRRGITLVGLVVTIVILLILVGVTIGTLGGENGLLSKTKLAKNRYEISEAKEKLEFAITELRIEEEGKGESFTKEDLIKLNNDKIDVKSTDNFPVFIIYENYKFSVGEQFIVTYVGEASETIITYKTTPEGYTNQDSIKLTIKMSNAKGIRTIEFPDGGTIECFGRTEYSKDYSAMVNGTYTYKVTDMEGNKTTKEILIDKIDKLAPKDFTPGIQKTDVTITIKENGEDAEADETSSKSGIAYYEYYIVDENNVTTKYEKNQVENLALGTYKVYVIAYDRAGNSKKSSEVEFKISIQFSCVEAGNHSLGIDNKGNLWAWGNNDVGQLGDGTSGQYAYKTRPVQIKKETKFSQVSAGSSHSLAIDSEGNLWVWGYNEYGRLGDGTTTQRTSPIQIKDGIKFSQVSAGSDHSLAIDSEGNLWAWGYNGRGQLGDGTTTQRTSPVQIKEGTQFVKVSAGDSHSLAIDNEGNLWAWGSNSFGQVGNGTSGNFIYSPVQIKSGTKFSQISAGSYHSLAIDSEGNLWAWGYNELGQLGYGTTTQRTSPIQIKDGTKFSQISAGYGHSLAIDASGNLWAWGTNIYGQVGEGVSNDIKNPLKIKEGTKFNQVAAGNNHSLAIDSEGKLWAWGYNGLGQLGDGTRTNRSNPVQI